MNLRLNEKKLLVFIKRMIVFSLLFVLFVSGNILFATGKPMGKYVGKLEESWYLPSDHLPIGAKYGSYTVLSWNVLNTAHISWVMEKDSQGLKDSVIGKQNILAEKTDVTLRDLNVIDCIKKMSFDILALQEAGKPFVEEVRKQLSDTYVVIYDNYESAVIFNKNVFSFMEEEVVNGAFFPCDKRTVQHVVLEDVNKEKIRIINVHIPGNPSQPCRELFACHLVLYSNSNEDVIALGDMNFNEIEMKDAFEKAGIMNRYMHYHPMYCTNIEPFSYISKTIDHLFIKSLKSVNILSANEVLLGLEPLASIISDEER
jgi:endonuclease/exonuclease/phosphatase family metal-dependent hydrolase